MRFKMSSYEWGNNVLLRFMCLNVLASSLPLLTACGPLREG